jgi:hypothetical protein
MPNVVLTPHMAAASDQLEHRLVVLAMENLRRYTAGERLISLQQGQRAIEALVTFVVEKGKPLSTSGFATAPGRSWRTFRPMA